MKTNATFAGLLVATSLTAGGAVPGFAQDNGMAAAPPANIQVTLAEAAQAAEKNTGGKASAVVLENRDSTPTYEIDVTLPDGAKQQALVDAATGDVVLGEDGSDEQEMAGDDDGSHSDDHDEEGEDVN